MDIFHFGKQREDINTSNRLLLDGNYVSYGYNNRLPDEILYMVENSPTHGAIIDKKAKYTAGSKILSSDESFLDWATHTNNGKGLHNLLYRCAYDYHLFGGYCVQVVFFKNQRKISDIIYQDFSQVRRGFIKFENGTIFEQDLAISMSWDNKYKYTPSRYKYYSDDMLDIESPNEPVFLYFYDDSAGREWYPLPTWWGAWKNILTEIEANHYILNQVLNSFHPCGFLSVPTQMPEEQKKMFSQKVKEEMSGTDNAGKIMVTFNTDSQNIIQFTPLTNTFNHSGMLDLLERNQRLILTAHQITSPALVGLPSGATLGGDGNTIEQASQEFYANVIQPAQSSLFVQLNKLIVGAGFDVKLSVENSYIKNIQKNEG
jgi:hypothetical protein